MANTIRIKRKTTSGAPASGDLSDGELCLVVPDQTLWIRVSAGVVIQINGGGGSAAYFRALKDSTAQTLTGSYADLIGWKQENADSPFSFNTTTGILTLNDSGLYLGAVDVQHNNTSVNNRVQLDVLMQVDTGSGFADVTELEWHNYSARNTAQDQGGTGGTFMIPFAAGDQLKITVRRIGVSPQIIEDYARWYMTKL
jgi:hypothetical protein